MGLPIIDLPTYEVILPSTGEKIQYRAFTTKEEKIMLIAKESNDSEQHVIAIKQVLNNCLLGKKTIDELAIFDIELILLLIRGKSVNNIAEFTIEDPETGEDVTLKLNIDDVTVHRHSEHTNKIKLNDEYTLFMKYPSVDMFLMSFAGKQLDDPLIFYDVMVACMDKVASADNVFKFSDFSKEEVEKFLEDLDGNVTEIIRIFFDTMPRLRHEIKYTNSKGNEKTFVIEGTDSFFI